MPPVHSHQPVLTPEPVATIEVVGPAGRIKINKTDWDEYKRDGYTIAPTEAEMTEAAAAAAADAALKAGTPPV